MRMGITRRGLMFLASAPVVAACSETPGPQPTRAAAAASEQAASPTPTPTPTPSPTPPPPPPPPELPGGGRTVFPTYRLFGYSGYPGAPGQGRMGIGKLDDRLPELKERAKPYLAGRKLMPVMELIAVTVHARPGADGMFRSRTKDDIIQTWLDAARRHGAMLLLNIQPGRAKFLDEVKYFHKWLKEPDIGLALDPEWAVKAGQIPGRVYGSTTADELNSVGQWVSGVVAANNLPEKVIVYHQLHAKIVRNEEKMRAFPGIAWVKSIDGIGSPGAKVQTYNLVKKTTPPFVHAGFKLFYEEDVATGGRLMTPQEVLALEPQPEYVLFE